MIEVKNPLRFEILLGMSIGFFSGFAGGNFIGRSQGYASALKEVKQEVDKRLDELAPGSIPIPKNFKGEVTVGGKAKPKYKWDLKSVRCEDDGKAVKQVNTFDLGSTSQPSWTLHRDNSNAPATYSLDLDFNTFDPGSAPLSVNENNFVDIRGLESVLDNEPSVKNIQINKPKGKECKQLMIAFRGLIIHGVASGETGCIFSF